MAARAVELAVPALADGCALQLVTPDGKLQPAAAAHTDARVAPLLGGMLGDSEHSQSTRDAEHEQASVAYVAIPISVHATPSGVLWLARLDGARRARPIDRTLAREFGALVAEAIEHADDVG